MNHISGKRVLFVSYSFPPVGGVGVQRVTKFVKYLPQFGWNSSVLTVSNPSVPLLDETLFREIPCGTIIRRAKTYEPGYAVKQAVAEKSTGKSNGGGLKSAAKGLLKRAANFLLQPDPQVLWHPHAYRAGLKLLREVPHDAIIATGPPFSSLLLGAKLAKRSGLPLILDYRDEWDISNTYWENKGQGKISNWLQHRQQARAVRAAKLLLATTPSSTRAVADFAKRAGSHAEAACLYNGFDPADYAAFTTTAVREKRERFQLAFLGTLWNLNSIQPLVEAMLLVQQRNPQLLNQCELLVAGRRMPDQEAQLDRLSATGLQLTKLPFVSHSAAIDLMRGADALLMLNSDVPQAQRIINAKAFEYMAARRPMFVIAPQGDVWDVVRDLPGTVLCAPHNIPAIAQGLEMLIEQHRCGVNTDNAHWDIARFERQRLTGELANWLDTVTPDRRPVSDGHYFPLLSDVTT